MKRRMRSPVTPDVVTVKVAKAPVQSGFPSPVIKGVSVIGSAEPCMGELEIGGKVGPAVRSLTRNRFKLIGTKRNSRTLVFRRYRG